MAIAVAKREKEREGGGAICRALTDSGFQEGEEFHDIAECRVMSNIRSDITRYRVYILLELRALPR